MHKLVHASRDSSLNAVDGLDHFSPQATAKHLETTPCSACGLSKSKRLVFRKKSSTNLANEPMDLFHADLAGPISAVSDNDSGNEIALENLSAKKYVSLIVDSFSLMYFVCLIPKKSDAAEGHAIPLIRQLQTITNRTLKYFKSDGGKEYINDILAAFLDTNGTTQLSTVPNTPQHNGTPERAWQTLFAMVRSMLYHAGLPLCFWCVALACAVYIRNRCIIVRDSNKTPFEMMFKRKPTVKHFRVFGCDCFVHQHDTKKLEPRAKRGIMVGYDQQDAMPYYLIFLVEELTIIRSRDVTFHEASFTHAKHITGVLANDENFIFQNSFNTPLVLKDPVQALDDRNQDDSEEEQDDLEIINHKQFQQHNNNQNNYNAQAEPRYDDDSDSEILLQSRQRIEQEIKEYDDYGSNGSDFHLSDEDEDNFSHLSVESTNPSSSSAYEPDSISQTSSDHQSQGGMASSNRSISESRRSDNSSKTDTLEERFLQQVQEISQRNEEIEDEGPRRSGRNRRAPLSDGTFINPNLLNHDDHTHVFGSFAHCRVTALISVSNRYLELAPKNFRQAMKSKLAPQWLISMQKEFNSHKENRTWDLMQRQPWMKVIPVKWHYVIKLNKDNEIDTLKSRIVVIGYMQGNVFLTFAPVMSYISLRIILCIGASLDYEIKQMDVTTAFLNAKIDTEIYVEQPEGFKVAGKETWVCKLNKALYGTKDAPRAWNIELNGTIELKLHYKRSIYDQCIYFKLSRSGRIMILGVFVDDMISLYSHHDEQEWLELKAIFANTYKIKDLGDVEFILKMRVRRDRLKKTLTLDQEAYVDRIVEKFNMTESGIQKVPISTTNEIRQQNAEKVEQSTEMKAIPYLPLIGSVLYAALTTRPDIAFAVNMCTRVAKNPNMAHWRCLKRVLKYLKGTRSARLVFPKPKMANEPFLVSAYCDADWAGDQIDRKSTSGHVILVNNTPVCWLSKKQEVVALSSCESELLSLASCTRNVIWIRLLIEEITNTTVPTTVIHLDNQSSKKIVECDTTSNKTKHVAIRYHFVRDHIEKKEIKIVWTPTNEQVADIFTKALSVDLFTQFRDQLITIESTTSQIKERLN